MGRPDSKHDLSDDFITVRLYHTSTLRNSNESDKMRSSIRVKRQVYFTRTRWFRVAGLPVRLGRRGMHNCLVDYAGDLNPPVLIDFLNT